MCCARDGWGSTVILRDGISRRGRAGTGNPTRAAFAEGYIYVGPHIRGVQGLKVPQPPEDANPRLSTLLEVEAILVRNLKDWEGPLSFAEIGRRMSAKKVRPAVVRACVQELVRQGRAVVGSKGVDLLVRSPALEKTRTEPLA
jgi:hypothetical protein